MSTPMFVTAIIAAGGRGTRLGGGPLKQLRPIGGRAILERSVQAFVEHPMVSEVIVALPAEILDDPPAYLRGSDPKPIRLVRGAERRQDSVASAFRATTTTTDVVIVHDAARPFVSADLIERTVTAAAETGAAVAALASRETVKRAELVQAQDGREQDPLTLSLSKGERLVAETLPRESIFLAQTPQAFQRSVLQDALQFAAREGVEATDEATLVERAGHKVRLVDGDASNIKITTVDDLAIAEAIAGRAPVRTGRVGTGYDLHRLVEGRRLVIGGVTIPSERGALGHSDADVACHAISDALLGAACLGDIGFHFPDTDPRWKDASSLDLLARAATAVSQTGYEIGNVDVTVILEAPRIREHVETMRQTLARTIGVDPDRVSVKAKTNEGTDALGRGEAVAAHAIVLIRSRESRP